MHEYFHTAFGWCLWDVTAIAVCAVMIGVLVVHTVKQHKREKNFQEELDNK